MNIILLTIQAFAIALLTFNTQWRYWFFVRLVAAALSILIAGFVGFNNQKQKRDHLHEAQYLRNDIQLLQERLESVRAQVKDIPNLPSQVRTMIERDLIPDAPRFLQDASNSIRINSPRSGSYVSNRTIVSGFTENRDLNIWVIVHPDVRKIREFWVQEKATLSSNGDWHAGAYFGRHGEIDKGVPYEVMAVANPEISLQEGQVLDWWPRAEFRSEIVNVKRK